MFEKLKQHFRKAFPGRQGAFVQADEVGDLHHIRQWAKLPSKPLPKPRPGCEGKKS